MQMCGGFIILSDLCGREVYLFIRDKFDHFLSDLCGREAADLRALYQELIF